MFNGVCYILDNAYIIDKRVLEIRCVFIVIVSCYSLRIRKFDKSCKLPQTSFSVFVCMQNCFLNFHRNHIFFIALWLNEVRNTPKLVRHALIHSPEIQKPTLNRLILIST